jgi:hypothetical protein
MRTFARTFAFVALVAVACGGCGFERESPFAGRRVPDVGPWQDLGALTVCRAQARIVGPSLGAAGLCRTAAPLVACTADGDCKSRERCVCGRCAVAACDSAEECGPADGPFVCSFADRRCDRRCDVDGDCATGEHCLAGRHVCRGGCTTSDDCQHDETCQPTTGLCVVTACSLDADCGGRACALQRIAAVLAEPSPLPVAGAVELWLERTDADGIPRVWHGRGDGVAFALDDAPELDGTAPTVARLTDGSYAIVFGRGADLFAARSHDGLRWSTPTPALANARQPTLLAEPDGTFALYAVDTDGHVSRFVAGADLAFATPQLVLAPTDVRSPLWPDVDVLASPFAERYVDGDGGPRLRLWFAAHGTENAPSMQFGVPVPSSPDFSVGVAVSLDGARFIPDAYDPVFSRTLDFINHPSALDPAVVALGDRWLLYYRRAMSDGSGGESLAVAQSPVQPR